MISDTGTPRPGTIIEVCWVRGHPHRFGWSVGKVGKDVMRVTGLNMFKKRYLRKMKMTVPELPHDNHSTSVWVRNNIERIDNYYERSAGD